jgi:PAS domain-containing protein
LLPLDHTNFEPPRGQSYSLVRHSALPLPKAAVPEALIIEWGFFEGQRVRKDGTPFWAHVVIDAIRDDDGKLVGFAKVTRDITERREAEAALQAAQAAIHRSQKLEAKAW